MWVEIRYLFLPYDNSRGRAMLAGPEQHLGLISWNAVGRALRGLPCRPSGAHFSPGVRSLQPRTALV